MHDAGHERMQGAGVFEVALAGKRMLELVVSIQTLRGETLVVARHGMRRFVVIGPDDLGAGCNRDFLRPERELRYIDGRRGRRCRRERRRHPEDSAEKQRQSGTAAKKMDGVAKRSIAHETVLA